MNTIKTALVVSLMALTTVPVFAQPLNIIGGNYISREKWPLIFGHDFK
ncbi:hypothetical protein [Vibrio fluvialis]|nr:hypothetical protein [Vibrio fluvialis]